MAIVLVILKTLQSEYWREREAKNQELKSIRFHFDRSY